MHQTAPPGQGFDRSRLDFTMSSADSGGCRCAGRVIEGSSVVHLSVAIGRFFEALLWALARGVGVMAAWAVLAAVVLGVVALIARAIWRRR